MTNKHTGEPVQARVMFTPHVESKTAKEYLGESQYMDPMRMTLGADTDDAGVFRIRAVPGEGILVALCEDHGHCPEFGLDTLDEKWFFPAVADRPSRLKTFHSLLPNWSHSFKHVSAEAGKTISEDLVVDPGNTLDVHLVDAANQPLTGVQVRRRLPSWNSEPPSETSTVLFAEFSFPLAIPYSAILSDWLNLRRPLCLDGFHRTGVFRA